MAMQQQGQHKYYRRSFCRQCIANAAGPCTTVGTGIDSKQLCLTFVGSLNRPIQIGIGRYACIVLSIPRKTLGLRPTDQSCHHETWLHLDFVDRRSTQSHHEEPDRRILLKERPVPYKEAQKRRISDIMSEPFALFLNVQPFARARQPCAEIYTSSRSDLMIFSCL